MSDTLEQLAREKYEAGQAALPGAGTEPPAPKPTRANYVAAPHYYHLTQACRLINEAFGDYGCYLVGSSTRTKEYRDVDVRFIMGDAQFERLFGTAGAVQCHPLWTLLCSTISDWLSKVSGLPVDFQIQKQSVANENFSRKDGHERQSLGMFYDVRPAEPYPGGG